LANERPTALIAGGGVGGLATAIRLANAGYAVTVLEKNSTVGGRANTIDSDGFHFDTGPTLLLMPDVYRELWASAGAKFDDYVQIEQMVPNYKITFEDGLKLTVTPDLEELERELETIEPGAGAGLRKYMEQAGTNYRVSRDHFVERNFLSLAQFAHPKNLGLLLKTRALNNLFKEAGRYFKDDRLKLAFTFQSMYLGDAPTDSMSIYSLLPYTELAEGIWYPRGGIYQLIAGMEKFARELGVTIETNAKVVEIETEGRTATGARMADGRLIRADVVVSNVDLPTTYNRLLSREARKPYSARKLRRLKYTASTFMLYLGVNREYPDLAHHNVLFAEDFNENFDAIFGKQRRLPGTPSLYVNASSRTDPTVAPAGSEAIYVLVPVSNMEADTDWRAEGKRFRDLVVERLEKTLMPDLSKHIVFEAQKTPLDWMQEFALARGATFGLSHGFTQVGYFRPQNKAKQVDNLYFVGASTVPGAGVPMVIIGSRLVTERILDDWGQSGERTATGELSRVP
jgi:phytoene desaturase